MFLWPTNLAGLSSGDACCEADQPGLIGGGVVSVGSG